MRERVDNNSDIQLGDFAAVAALPFALGLLLWLLVAVVAGIVDQKVDG